MPPSDPAPPIASEKAIPSTQADFAAIRNRLETSARTDTAEQSRQERERLCVQALRRLSIDLGQRYAPDRVRLDHYAVYHAAQKTILERLHALKPTLAERVAQGDGLVFYGPVGTGKDHLLAAMLYVAAGEHGITCRWVNGQEIYGQFRDRMDTGQREEDLLRELSAPQVLAISDPIPPAGSPSNFNLSQLYRLLDRRYRSMLSTWVSLNAASLEDADTKLSAPVFDRLRESAELFPCFWPSYRERQRKPK